MKKSYLWRKMTSGLMAAAVTVTAMPGLGLTMVPYCHKYVSELHQNQ